MRKTSGRTGPFGQKAEKEAAEFGKAAAINELAKQRVRLAKPKRNAE